MQLSFDAADRLVELVQASRGAGRVGGGGARAVRARARAGGARPLAPRRRRRRRRAPTLARRARRPRGRRAAPTRCSRTPSSSSSTSRRPGSRPRATASCEIGALRVEALEIAETFETLVDPGRRAAAVDRRADRASRDAELRGAPRSGARRPPLPRVRGRRAARRAQRALRRGLPRPRGRAAHGPPRRRARGRHRLARAAPSAPAERALLARASSRTSSARRREPCHRALPDALATAEILVALLGLAQERGARTLADLVELAAPRARRLHGKRSLVAGAPTTPGVYLFRDRNDTVLYVGKARDLRARLRSYFAGDRQRPAVEAALGALERVEWRELGSELEAALEELRLIRELRPPANARGARPTARLPPAAGRALGRRRRADPLRADREQAPRAAGGARARRTSKATTSRDALAPLRAKLRRLARDLRFEDAARLRDRLAALEEVVARIEELERLRAARAVRPRARPRAGLLARVRRRARAGWLPARSREARQGGSSSRRRSRRRRASEPSLAPEDADELLVVVGGSAPAAARASGRLATASLAEILAA